MRDFEDWCWNTVGFTTLLFAMVFAAGVGLGLYLNQSTPVSSTPHTSTHSIPYCVRGADAVPCSELKEELRA